ncbi:Uncharacterised protein [Vibrio cholerae]|nr:Uncharacterised protein [Vibrio cholerae]
MFRAFQHGIQLTFGFLPLFGNLRYRFVYIRRGSLLFFGRLSDLLDSSANMCHCTLNLHKGTFYFFTRL